MCVCVCVCCLVGRKFSSSCDGIAIPMFPNKKDKGGSMIRKWRYDKEVAKGRSEDDFFDDSEVVESGFRLACCTYRCVNFANEISATCTFHHTAAEACHAPFSFQQQNWCEELRQITTFLPAPFGWRVRVGGR